MSVHDVFVIGGTPVTPTLEMLLPAQVHIADFDASDLVLRQTQENRRI